MKVLHVVGARPNFMKVAPICREMDGQRPAFEQELVHTGQHYDRNMSDVFFEQLRLPPPLACLNAGSGTHAQQTAHVMLAFEPVVQQFQPDWVIVVGDVNSTLACALVCSKLHIKVAHVEAGLRSGDRSMPEEINRILTDQLSDLLFTPSLDGNTNLEKEGIPAAKIRFVGNVMIDSLVRFLPEACGRNVPQAYGLSPREYLLVTLHRPSNVDDTHVLGRLMSELKRASERWPVVFPVHPRTRQRLSDIGFASKGSNIRFTDPLDYFSCLGLMNSARAVLTDSGGIQEETTFLGVRCLTLRRNMERPATITSGTNTLLREPEEIVDTLAQLPQVDPSTHMRPELWDGHTAERIVKVFRDM
jgi:UDP-N-acetylglucosamine 2-epimerase (non-hydrolysing)